MAQVPIFSGNKAYRSTIRNVIENILNDYQQSVPADEKRNIVYPGQRVPETRKHNLQNGIPVLREVWQDISKL